MADDVDDGETEHERLNRNLEQLLQELRVALPGVQVLFAFLLAVPFATRWTNISDATSGSTSRRCSSRRRRARS